MSGTWPFGAHSDNLNQQFSILGVVGTLGTADAKGTANTLPAAVDPATGAWYVNNIGAPSGNPSSGTLNTIGTLGTLQAGTVTVAGGTIQSATAVLNNGTINVGTFVNNGGTLNVLQAGTINSATVVLNSGTINVATVTLNSGTINVATVTLNSGTINVGTVVNNGGTIAVVQNAGTIATGANTIGNVGTLIAGTINSATAVLNSGTINVGTFVNNGGTIAVVQNAGTIATGANTIGNVGTLIAGTINAATAVLNNGTINVGTVTASINPLPLVNTISHTGTSGTTAIGTLITAATMGVGTACYITSFHLLVISGTPEITLAFGSQTNGNQVVAHGLFPAGGGIAKDIAYPHGYGTTNSALTYQINSGAGTVSWDVNYFLHT